MKSAVTPLSLGTDRLANLLLRYAIPSIIAMTSSSLYNIIDSIFIGHGVGALAISGLAITLPLMNIASAFGSMVGIGAAAIISIRLGEGNRTAAENTLGNVVLLNILIGMLFMIVSLLFLDPILYFFGASEQTIGYARDFMQIILAGAVVTHMYLGLNEVLRASGYPQKAMFIMLTAVAVNCILNPLFIFGFGWGIRGSACATVIAQMTALSVSLHHFLNRESFLHFKQGIFRLRRKIVDGIISIGLAPFLLHVCASIVAGLNQGMQPIVGYNYGAKQYTRVLKTLGMTIFCAVCATTAGFLMGQLFPRQVAMLFVGANDAHSAELIGVARQGLRTVLMVFPIVGFQIVTSNFFQYIGKPKKAIFMSLTRQMLFLVPLLILLPRHFGAMGVWLSMPIADSTASILAAVLLYYQVRDLRRKQRETALGR